MKKLMKTSAQLLTSCAFAFGVMLAAAPDASACMGHRMEPVKPTTPKINSDAKHAAMTTPLHITKFDSQGRRYWRAVYEVLATQGKFEHQLQRVVLEWACDPAQDGADVCGANAASALPGFTDSRPSGSYVQLELDHLHSSTFDGTPVFGAAPGRAMLILSPVKVPQPRIGGLLEEQAHRKAPLERAI